MARSTVFSHEDGRMAPGVCGNGSVLLSHSGNVVPRIGIYTHIFSHIRQMINDNMRTVLGDKNLYDCLVRTGFNPLPCFFQLTFFFLLFF